MFRIRFRLNPPLLIVLAGFLLLRTLPCSAQDSAVRHSDSQEIVVESAQSSHPSGVETSEERKERLRQSAVAGLLVLSLVCVVFLVLILVVALWARRIRMMTRQPLPEQQPGDPLWYLKNPQQSGSGNSTALSNSDIAD